MKLALTYNLKTGNIEADQEFDAPHHVAALVAALRRIGHEVRETEVTRPVSAWLPGLFRWKPALVFNIAEGRGSRAREAVCPTLFEQFGLPYTGSDPYALTVTLDKWLTKVALRAADIIGPKALCRVPRDVGDPNGTYIVKPRFEGSSMGITEHSVGDLAAVCDMAERLSRKYPDGVLIEEFVPGIDITVPWMESRGALTPCTVVATAKANNEHGIYTYRQKGLLCDEVSHVAYEHEDAREVTERIAKHLQLRDFARVDYRLDTRGCLWFLEVNALPSLEYDGALAFSAKQSKLDYDMMLGEIIWSAMRRHHG